MDIGDTLAPASDQIDNIELAGGPRTVTITDVTRGSAEQPIQIHVAEFDRPWRPGKTVRRLIVAAWGSDSTAYIGRRVTIFRDPEVTYGRDKTGGIRISAMSDLPDGKPITETLMIRRGQWQAYTVNPLPEPAPNPAPKPTTEPTPEQVAACTDLAELRTMWHASGPERKAQIEARKAELDTTAPGEGDES